MSKILLVNTFPYPYYPAIGLGYIGTYVMEKGHTARIFEMGYGIEAFRKVLKEFNPDFVGFNTYSNKLFYLEQLIVIVREYSGVRAKILLGGHHVTALPRESWERFDCDYVVLGESEKKVLDIMNGVHITKLKGIIGLNGIHVYENLELEYIADLDVLPFPNREMMDTPRYQQEYRKKKRMYTQISAGRGCPRNCSFCVNRVMWGKKYRQRSVANVLDEIEWLIPQGYREFDILDDTFTANKKYLLAFCNGIKERGLNISYQVQGRVDMFDTEIADALVKTGCHNLLFGVESCNQHTLDFLRKGTKIEQIKKSVRIAEDAGINVGTCLIYNLPNETLYDLINTFQTIIELNPYWVFLTPLTIFPKSGLETFFVDNEIEIDQSNLRLDQLGLKPLT